MPRPKTDSWDDIAAFLCIDSRQIHRMRKEPGAPVGKDRNEWDAFLRARKGPQVPLDGTSPEGLPGDNPYDGVLDYKSALLREQVRGEMTKNKRLEAELSIVMKDLMTREEAKKRALAWNDAANARMDLVERFADGLDGLSPDQRRSFLDRVRDWRIQTRTALNNVNSNV